MRFWSCETSMPGAVERLLGTAHLGLDAGPQVGARREGARLGCRSTRMFSGATCASCPVHALDLRQQPLVDHQQPGARLVEHAGEHLAAQPRVDAEQRQPGVGAAAVERQQLHVVVEQHRHVSRVGVVDAAEAAQEKMRHAHRLVAELAVGPGAIAVHAAIPCRRRAGCSARASICPLTVNGALNVNGSVLTLSLLGRRNSDQRSVITLPHPVLLAVCRTWNHAATQRGADHRKDADRRS